MINYNMKNAIIFGIMTLIIGFFIGILIMNPTPPTTTTTIPATTTTITEIISCSDDFDCPSKMKCENSVCVDVGCVGEDESIPSMSINPKNREHMATECCGGLTVIEWPKIYDENCDFTGIVGYPAGVCTKCGNGLCEYPETKCNCPEDCVEGECYTEGESFDLLETPNATCCSGLTQITMSVPEEPIGKEDYCVAPSCPCYICTECGDGTCGKGENWCNCPDDCERPEEVPCIENVECGFDFCGQGRNVCYETKYTCENGQCSSETKEYVNYSCAKSYYHDWDYPENSKCIDTCGDDICRWPETKWWCPEDCS